MTTNDVAPANAGARNLVDQLEANVRGQLSGRVRGMRLLMHDDGLVLKGRAQTYYAKQLAQHLVMRATTIPIVANEIEVS